MKTKLIFLLIFLSFARVAAAQDLAAELMRDVEFLTDPALEGRGVGLPASQPAVFHIFNAFKDAGLWTSVQSFKAGDRVGHNVIGRTPGYYDEWLVIGAYFDGIGKVDGNVYPCADSNASGTAALMALARRWPRECSRMGIIYVAFDAHNADMAGSRTFAESLPDASKVKMMVNLDILGGTSVPVLDGRPDYMIVLGTQGFSWQIFRANIGTELHLSYNYYGSGRFTDLFYKSMADQKWFVQRGVPAVMFTAGISMDTNKITDTADKLDYGIMARRVDVIRNWIVKSFSL